MHYKVGAHTGGVAVLIAIALAIVACGRGPSRLLRQGSFPILDFPLYASVGSEGTILKFESDGTQTTFASGLNNPLGVATDRFNHLYVVEAGSGSLLKFDVNTGAKATVLTGLLSPTMVAVDSVGEVYVNQLTPHNILRVGDLSEIASFYSQPTALAFGVNDTLLVGDATANLAYWGKTSDAPSATVTEISNLAIDGTGRVYAAEGSLSHARVLRFHQLEPGGTGTVVAEELSLPVGIAVDSVGNIYVAENGLARILLVRYNGDKYEFAANLTDPQYLSFTQY